MAYGTLVPRPGMEPVPPALESRVLTTGPPGKSPMIHFKLTYVYSARYRSKFNFFSYGYRIVLAPFVEIIIIV